jgi:exopolysaccharide biosynthesis polyprenyl glycosylphosphotransferase
VVRTRFWRQARREDRTLNQKGFAAHGGGTDAIPIESVSPVPSNAARPFTRIPAASPRRHRFAIAFSIAVDLAAVILAFGVTALVRFTPAQLGVSALSPGGSALVVMGALLWWTFLTAHDAYAPRVMISISSQLLRVLGAALPAWVLTHFLAFVLKIDIPFSSRLAMGLSLPAVLVALAAGRMFLVRPLARRAYPRLARGPILVLGDTERAQRLVSDLEEDHGGARSIHLRPLSSATPERVRELVETFGFSEVVIEPEGRSLEEVFDTAFACLDARAEVVVVSNVFQVVAGRAAIGDVEGIPAMRFRRLELTAAESILRRMIDILGSTSLLIALAPFLTAIALAVKVTSRGPIFFRQERVGRRGRRFTMYKFRTMVDGNDSSIHREYLRSFIKTGAAAAVGADGAKIYKLTGDPRVTRVGAWLRALSLDELPQLWNVLRGEMSLVGPRPCLPYEWDLYRPWQRRRLDVIPGCTGLWQVTARSHVTFEEMVILDLHYAHHGNVGRDLWLIAQTVPAMVRGRGGY